MTESVISFVLLILLVFLMNPFDFWMPSEFHMMIIVLVAFVFILFAILISKEKTRDEREELHRYIAGRISYLVGSTILVTGVVIQSLKNTLDPFLVISLFFMILGKMIALIYARTKH